MQAIKFTGGTKFLFPDKNGKLKVGDFTKHSVINVKMVFQKCELRRSKSENNLFFTRYLSARFPELLPRESIRSRFGLSNDLIKKFEYPSFGERNRKHICRYVSDSIIEKYAARGDVDLPEFSDAYEDEGDSPDLIDTVQDKYKGAFAGVDALEIANLMVNLSDLGFDLDVISKCSLRQQAVIVKYVSQMVECGYRFNYIKAVLDAMVMLYTTKIYGYTIEECLPSRIEENDYKCGLDGKSLITSGEYFRVRRKWIADRLFKIMDANGGEYKIIARYCSDQQKHGSWCRSARLLKGFYLEQMTDAAKNGSYFLKSGTDLSQSQGWDPGVEAFIGQFHAQYPPNSPAYDTYFKTIAIHQGFIAIALYYIEGSLEVDKNKGTITVFRGIDSHFVYGQPQGVLDSASLKGTSLYFLGENVLKIEMPLCEVRFIYFLSFEMCEKNRKYAEEREVIGSFGNAVVTNQTKINLSEIHSIKVVGFRENGRVLIDIGGNRAYLEEPYVKILEASPDGARKKIVRLCDKYHFWDDQISVEVVGKEYKGYTDDPRIIEIAEKAAAGELSKEDIGKYFSTKIDICTFKVQKNPDFLSPKRCFCDF